MKILKRVSKKYTENVLKNIKIKMTQKEFDEKFFERKAKSMKEAIELAIEKWEALRDNKKLQKNSLNFYSERCSFCNTYSSDYGYDDYNYNCKDCPFLIYLGEKCEELNWDAEDTNIEKMLADLYKIKRLYRAGMKF